MTASPWSILVQKRSASVVDKAKRYVSLGNKVKQQLGPTEASILVEELSDDFEFVAPLVGPLNKQAIIAATEGLDLGAAVPDFDARYHDWRVDAEDPTRVWATMRVTGTQTGALAFAGREVAPTTPPVTVTSPPEAVSFRFDATSGKLCEITTGYPIDRRVGTTSGLGGIFGILEGLGSPLPAPLTRTTGQLLGLLPAAAQATADPAVAVPKSAALPAAKLLRLTRDLHAAKFGAKSGDARAAALLAPSFEFTGPVVGPLGKDAFLEAYGAFNLQKALPDLDYAYRDLRCCPYDVNRVWYTSSPRGTHTGAPLRIGDKEHPPTGKAWESPPECGSAQFDGEGRCVALTGGYVMDRRMGNTAGLGGIFGLCVALGLPAPLPVFLLRTPVQNLGRLRAFFVGEKL